MMRDKISILIFCILLIQFGGSQTTQNEPETNTSTPFSDSKSNSSSNGTASNITITIVEKKLPDFLTSGQLDKMNLIYDWDAAKNRTAFNQTDSNNFVDGYPKDLLRQEHNSKVNFSCPRKNNSINPYSPSPNKTDANSTNETETQTMVWRIIDLVEKPNLKIVTTLNSATLTDENTTITVDAVTSGDDGYYMCILHNSTDIVDARAAVLTVLPAPPSPPPKKTTMIIIISAIILLVLLSLLGVGVTLRYRRQKALLLSRANNAEALNNWIKTIIIEKDGDVKDVLRSPVVRIELNKRAKHGYAENVEYELPVDTDWEFDRNYLNLGDGLGEGEFGKVLKGEAYGIVEPEVWTTVAVKMLKESHTDDEMKGLVAELEIMKMIGKHKNVLSLLKCCSQGGPLLVITEFASHGNLKEFLRKCNANSRDSSVSENEIVLNNKTLISFARQIAEGMEYLASIKCVHRDLAARNVLVSEDYVMKVADFGLARDIQNNDYYRNKSSGKLPVRWMSPEALFERRYTCKSDIWSFGILLWEIMTLGGIPYPSVPGVEKLFQLLRSGYRMESPLNCPSKLYALMHECWHENPIKRPDFIDVMRMLDEILAENHQNMDFVPPPPPSIPSSTEKVYPSSDSDESDDSDFDRNDNGTAGAVDVREKFPLVKKRSSQTSDNSLEKAACTQPNHRSSIRSDSSYAQKDHLSQKSNINSTGSSNSIITQRHSFALYEKK